MAALAERLPDEALVYLGDTARVPYGTRSPATVVRYAERVAGHLIGRGVKALVVACNTATTWALAPLQRAGAARGLPVIGVIAPGVQTALAHTRGHVGVIGTEGTIRGGVYARLLRQARPEIEVTSVACPLFVALAEEGWTTGEIARLTAERYLAPLRDGPDTVILGCTHYPLLREVIAAALPGVRLVDSATATATAVSEALDRRGLRTDVLRAEQGAPPQKARRFLVTDSAERFIRVGAAFLGRAPEEVEVVDLLDADAARLVAC